jgi:hypothetical protein
VAGLRDFRERKGERGPYEGGKQVVHDLTLDHRFLRTLLARKASRVLRFRVIHKISNRAARVPLKPETKT